jgi:hypothetical protein
MIMHHIHWSWEISHLVLVWVDWEHDGHLIWVDEDTPCTLTCPPLLPPPWTTIIGAGAGAAYGAT